MYLGRKAVLKVLLAIMLCFCTVAVTGAATGVTVEAAVKAPTLKDSSKTLYAGYDSYTISIVSQAAKAVVTYKSSNAAIATVSKKGVVKPVTSGSCEIAVTIKQNNKTYNLKLRVTVKDPSVDMTQSTPYMNCGETFLFKAKATGSKSKIVWSTSDLDVATISTSGNVTAVSSGKVTIYAEVGKATAKCEMVIGTNRIGTFSNNITIYDDFTVYITIADDIGNESLSYDTPNENIISCEWEEEWDNDQRIALHISPNSVGTETITITSDLSIDQLLINVTVVEPPKDREILNAVDLYEKCGPSTVEITVTSGGYTSQGSGFFIGNGMIVTNYHVIEGAEKIVVKTADSKEFKISTIVGFEAALDLAILAIDKEETGLVLNQDKSKVGQTIYTLGSPLGLTGTMTKGMISTASRVMEDGVDYIQIDAAISPGNSGGPLVNEYGEVIGINTMYYVDGQNLNFAINIKELQKINTNEPMSVTEYHKQYDELMYEKFLANMVHEDPAKSQLVSTCQYIDSGVGVDGTLSISEDGDRFWFEMEEPGYFVIIVYYDTFADMENTYVDIYDPNLEFLKTAEEYEDGTEYLKIYLTPGQYVIYVNFDKVYTGSDVNYAFITAQNYE